MIENHNGIAFIQQVNQQVNPVVVNQPRIPPQEAPPQEAPPQGTQRQKGRQQGRRR